MRCVRGSLEINKRKKTLPKLHQKLSIAPSPFYSDYFLFVLITFNEGEKKKQWYPNSRNGNAKTTVEK